MNEKEIKEYMKQVSENEDSAIKLIEINKNLLDTIRELQCDVEHWKEEYNELKQNLEENYVRKEENPYTEYGISERDFS